MLIYPIVLGMQLGLCPQTGFRAIGGFRSTLRASLKRLLSVFRKTIRSINAGIYRKVLASKRRRKYRLHQDMDVEFRKGLLAIGLFSDRESTATNQLPSLG
ncbi:MULTISPECIES: hypothetical protein [unclassified Moorena]|uniref:hypothetical protein n=1 Tax=unclassified Moorena TaxID=2683338 RepID=UPI0013C5ED0A|nr:MULTISPECIES: hypothetical protein [unclassified Moorena]NEO23365.1 hypothetical protein [Moorena sp. SIO4A5]NEQ61010.1 hypothetical protein [Moorena sp. SIO4A1]